ncbi:MAG TPA: hypothetical protein VL326_33845 [Kofleriaceae bacterium]|nr:hypothetical protein [Kofleriaceae bacterium]
MASNLAWAERRLEKEQLAELRGSDRFVDFGVVLRVVRQDIEHGEELIPGAPPLVVLRTHRFGGMVDTKARPIRLCGPSRNPVVWFCSEDQEPLIVHDATMPDRLLVYGSEGAGKTAAQSMWAALRVIELTGAAPSAREIGMTAPTNDRAERIFEAITDRWPRSWWRWVERDRCFYLTNGVRVRLVSTHRQSKAEGSRVQGFNWSACGSDEMQDQLEVDADIEMRGRSAPHGRYKRFATATAKDSPDWRTWRDGAIAASDPNGKPLWGRFDLIGPRSPFVWPRVWLQRKETLSPREYQRRVLAQDVGPEKQVYSTWDRDQNLRPRPIGGDVSESVLAPWGNQLVVLGGHDPGLRNQSTVLLKPYQIAGKRRWWVVDELVTEGLTVEAHVKKLLALLRDKWESNLLDRYGRPQSDGYEAFFRADPYTDNGSDAKHPDKSVYRTFRAHGIKIMPAEMRGGVGVAKVQQIPRVARINMVKTLLCAESGERRLFVDCDENRKPCAPRLVAAFETLEVDAAGNAETDRKGEGDLTGPPVAVGYALWMLERSYAGIDNKKKPTEVRA